MKIGILTYHRSINYGAYLQAYALQNAISKYMGPAVKVEIIDYDSECSTRFYNKIYKKAKGEIDYDRFVQYIKFKLCIKRLKRSRHHFCSDDLDITNEFLKQQQYDLIVVGSDEIWKTDGMRGFPTAYWLHDLCDTTRKISYAASSRNRIDRLGKDKIKYIADSLSGFEYIGVRDRYTKKLVDSVVNKDISIQNCDPVFLHDFVPDETQFSKLKNKNPLFNEKKVLLIMIPDDKLCNLIKLKMGDEYVIVSVMDRNQSADLNILGLGPFEWVNLIAHADCVVTNRFHGCVFSVKFNKPFIAVDDYDDEDSSKMLDLLERMGLEDHYYPYQGRKIPKLRHGVVARIKEIIQKETDYKIMINNEQRCSDSFFDYLSKYKEGM